VLADKILGDKIIAERVYVGRDIRKKKKQESGNQNSHTSNAIEHNEFNIKHPLENKLTEHNIPSSCPEHVYDVQMFFDYRSYAVNCLSRIQFQIYQVMDHV
jgi:hypothetical protein